MSWSHLETGSPTKRSDTPVIVASIQDDQVQQVAHGESPPNPQIVVHVNLPNGNPLKVGPHSVHLSLVNTDTWPIIAERLFRVVQSAEAISIAIIGHLCFIVSRCSSSVTPITCRGHPKSGSKRNSARGAADPGPFGTIFRQHPLVTPQGVRWRFTCPIRVL
jgi:hypothetical protein